MKKALLSLLVVPAVMAVSPASAAASCPSTNLCLYQNANYGGMEWEFNEPTYGDFDHYVGDNANDLASSLDNNRIHESWVSRDWNPENPARAHAFCGGMQAANLLNWNYWDDTTDTQTSENMNDSISTFNVSNIDDHEGEWSGETCS